MKIAVIGDSHSRVFSHTNVFTPFFLGSGSGFNLCEPHRFDRLKTTFKKLVPEILQYNFDYIMLLFGEPGCRYQLKKDHLIHKKLTVESIELTVDTSMLKFSYFNYLEILKFSKSLIGDKLIVCSPISVFKPSLKYSLLFSDRLNKYCSKEDIKYIDVKKYIVKNGEVDDKYKVDPVHANQSILQFFETMLDEIGIKEVDLNLNIEEGFWEIKDRYSFNERFGCYCIEEQL